MLKINDVVTLSNEKEYVVVHLFKMDDKSIIVLNDLETNIDIKFAILSGNEIIPITDPELLERVIKKVAEDYKVLPQ
ncbi:MAG: hypothetical protein HFH47_00310 [Bacilli bacterium]|nr:hypothetical protein [Bacilli bacterium]